MFIKKRITGFTIVELLIVVVVIAILAAITIVAYNGVQKRTAESTLKSELQDTATALQLAATTDGTTSFSSFPSTVKTSGKVGLSLSTPSSGSSFCINGSYQGSPNVLFFYDSLAGLQTGTCSGSVIPGSGIGTASTTQTTLVADTFDRANSTNTVGAAQTGQTWVSRLGAWGISSNRAYSSTGNDGDIMGIDLAPNKNIEFTTRISGLSSSQYPGVMVRASDDGRYYLAEVNGTNGSIVLVRISSPEVEFGTTPNGAFTEGSLLTVRAKDVSGGVQLTVLVNGTSVLSYTDTSAERLSGTSIGLRAGTSGGNSQRFDDVTVTTAN